MSSCVQHQFLTVNPKPKILANPSQIMYKFVAVERIE
jgi:hypothetical protein